MTLKEDLERMRKSHRDLISVARDLQERLDELEGTHHAHEYFHASSTWEYWRGKLVAEHEALERYPGGVCNCPQTAEIELHNVACCPECRHRNRPAQGSSVNAGGVGGE